MLPFRFKVFKMHEKEDGPDEQDGWLKFDFVLEVTETQIVAFEEHVLFDAQNNPCKCVRVFFSDEDEVFACYSLNKFLELYNKEYDPLYKQYLKLKFLQHGIVFDPDPQPEPPQSCVKPTFWQRVRSLFSRKKES